MNPKRILLLAGVALLAAGCTMAPKYARPDAPVPAGWPQGVAYQDNQSAQGAPQARDLAWQEFFADRKLRQLIEMSLQSNRDLRLAALNVERARAIYGIQRAELLPAVDVAATGSRAQVPGDLSGTGRRETVESYRADLGVLSWEVDFFGRIRSLKDRALQEFLASDEARRAAQILLVSSVANGYLTLATDREKLALAESTLVAQEEAYNLVKRRHELGLATDIDLFRAQTPVDTSRREVVRFQQIVALDQNGLDLLLGRPTPAHLLPADLGGVRPPRAVSAGTTSEVLLSRPDVRQAEHRLRAANADIGAARAAFFPRISLTATTGTASAELTNLFQQGSATWAFAPQAAMPVFDARVWSALKASKAQQKIAVTQYEKAIQDAFREVADALAVRGTIDRELAAQESLAKAVGETYRLAQSRYAKGIDSYLDVLDAQRQLYVAEQVLVSLRLAKLASQVRLYAVLGGGGE